MRGTLEQAVERGVDLSHANLRRARLNGANLDGMVAVGACFWGADLAYTDLSGCNLKDADLRNTDLKDSCLAESNLAGSNLQGAYFSGTILRQCNMEDVVLSCPSFFTCDLNEVKNFSGALYRHKGELDITFEQTPIVINGLSRRLVALGNVILWGEQALVAPQLPPKFVQDCRLIKTTIDTMAACA